MTAEVLRLAGLSKIYRTPAEEIHAVRDVSLTVRRGEFAAIIGPSGSGKSTLLHLIGCLDTPTRGEYFFEGIPVHRMGDEGLAEIRNTKIGFVFQNFNLLPRVSARKNVELPLSYAGVPRSKRQALALAALAKVRLAPRSGHKPNELSGGERQRVAIARALVTEPSVILADEPTGNLDRRVGSEIMALLEELNREHGATILLITHDMEIARRCPRIVSLQDGKVLTDSAA